MNELLLHEMPIWKALRKRWHCWRKGGHNYIYTGRTYLGTTSFGEKHYMLHYVCEHCQHSEGRDEYERSKGEIPLE